MLFELRLLPVYHLRLLLSMPPFTKSVVRLRPVLSSEIQDLSVFAKARLGTTIRVRDHCQPSREDCFDFQAVYGPYASQDEVFRAIVEELASDVWEGQVRGPFARALSPVSHSVTSELNYLCVRQSLFR